MSRNQPNNPPHFLPDHVRATLSPHKGLGLVVAVSAGSDSVGLLRALLEIAPERELRLTVAHLDHGARGEASTADAGFVAELAERLHLPFELGRWTPSRPGHFEADARRARYAWLVEVARTRDAAAVAVGHTQDDQAETILHRLIRGTGLRGLAGMPAHRTLAEGIELIRPVLGVTRDEIRAYLRSIGQPWREDATNAELSRTRSRIRHDLLPKLADEYNPRVAEALIRLGRQAELWGRVWEDHLSELERAAVVQVGPDTIVLNRAVLGSRPEILRAEVLRIVWRRANWPEGPMTASRWQRIARWIEGTEPRKASVGTGVDLEATAEHLIFRRTTVESYTLPEPAPLPIPGAWDWPGGRLVATLDRSEPHDEVIDLDRLEGSLFIRPPRPGDRFEPLGLGGRSTPLADFFRGRRVSPSERSRVPLVCDRKGIVWVVGHRISHRVRRTEQTRRVLGLRWEPDA